MDTVIHDAAADLWVDGNIRATMGICDIAEVIPSGDRVSVALENGTVIKDVEKITFTLI